MGLFRLIGDVVGSGWNALKGTTQSTMWKEYFESGDMSNGVLMKRGEKILVNGGKNRRADNNLISSGSGIDVQEGQCMLTMVKLLNFVLNLVDIHMILRLSLLCLVETIRV